MIFIDTHAHLYEKEFADDIALVIARARQAGALKILLPPTDIESTRKAVELSHRYPDILHPMIGLHPEDVGEDYRANLNKLEQMLEADRCGVVPQFVAIGEVGLDYYWDKSCQSEQKEAFRIQIEWAARYQLPLMIHSRSAGGDLLETMRPWRESLKKGGVFHCFTGSIETARELLRFSPHFCLGIGGVLTFKNAHLLEVVKDIPIERIVLETDSPYMAPTPMRGKRNEPSYIPYIIDKLAQAKGLTPQQVGDITTQNAMRIFFGH